MLLDALMPVYDVVERHRTVVRATPERVYAAVRDANLAGGPLTSVLFALRLLPAAAIAFARSPRGAIAEWRAHHGGRRGVRLADFERAGFRVVADDAPREIVVGLLGRFWTPRGALRATVSASDFAAGPPDGFALAGWNFAIAPRADGRTELVTETRVRCAPDARARFRAYWLVVRPGSGLIRREMLRSIRRAAERSASR